AAQAGGHQHVLERAQLRQEFEGLEDETDLAPPHRRQTRVARPFQPHASELDRSRVWSVEAPKRCNSVDFPEPERPSTATSSPVASSRSTPSRTRTAARPTPYVFTSPAARATTP